MFDKVVKVAADAAVAAGGVFGAAPVALADTTGSAAPTGPVTTQSVECHYLGANEGCAGEHYVKVSDNAFNGYDAYVRYTLENGDSRTIYDSSWGGYAHDRRVNGTVDQFQVCEAKALTGDRCTGFYTV